MSHPKPSYSLDASGPRVTGRPVRELADRPPVASPPTAETDLVVTDARSVAADARPVAADARPFGARPRGGPRGENA